MKTAIALQLVIDLEKNFVDNGGFPTCFQGQAEYNSWVKHERMAHTEPRRKLICEDCTACYQRQMRRENRCVNMYFDVKDKIIPVATLLLERTAS